MNFLDDPRRSSIEPMHEFMQIWSNYYRERPRQGVSITWIAMCSVRDWSKQIKTIREGIAIGLPIRRIRSTEERFIADRVDKMLSENELWIGHKREKNVLITYYLKVHPSWPIGKIAKALDCKPWQVEKTVKDALFYFSTIWRD